MEGVGLTHLYPALGTFALLAIMDIRALPISFSVTCSGALDVTVADTTAQKEVEFRVKQTTDGKILVSVDPFLF